MAKTIVVIGAGAAGFSAALELADKGYKVKLIERNTLGSGSSGRNPGRMGHGFHYTDVDTALSYLNASIKVQKKYPGFLVAENIPDSPLRKGRYFIVNNSNPGKIEILQTYERIKAEYKRLVVEDSTNSVFGPHENFYRILHPSEYENDVNMDVVDLGIETNEHLFRWKEFCSYIRTIIEQHPNIEFLERTAVEKISRNTEGQTRFSLQIQRDGYPSDTLTTDFIVNSTWENIEKLNADIGIEMPEGQRTNRLKTLLVCELPPELIYKNSMFFCMGQHCMMSNMGDGTAMMTYANVTNIETSAGLMLSSNAERLLTEGPTSQEIEDYGQLMIKGISHYIPAMKNAKIKTIKFGVVQTQAHLTLDQLQEPNHAFNKRSDHCVRAEQIGLISNPCMKLFYFIDNAKIVAELVDKHIIYSGIIDNIIKEIKYRAIKERVKISPEVERKLREQLERGPQDRLQPHQIHNIITQYVYTARTNEGDNSMTKMRDLCYT